MSQKISFLADKIALQKYQGTLPASGPRKFIGSLFGLAAIAAAIWLVPLGVDFTSSPSQIIKPALTQDADIALRKIEKTGEIEETGSRIIELADNDFIGPSQLYEKITPPIPEPNRAFLKNLTLARGDTLMQLVTRAGATRSEAYNAITSLETRLNTRKLQIGQRIKVTFQEDPNDKKAPLESLAIKTDFDKYVVATLSGTNQFTTEIVTTPTLGLKMFAEGTIDDSLFLSAKRMAVPTEIITELIRIFSFDVDFQREIRKGDHFKVYYNRRISEETGEVSNGAIVYASLTLRGKEKAFYSFTPLEKSQSGRLDFFDKDGQSARRTLMKTPVDGARISSSFGRRKHPVLGYTRMHKGADFAVYTGTPIMAAGDGIIERSSRYGSYGNYIRIQHNDTYKTAYAHLSRYGKDIKKGVRVKQGQIIGYSGATGRVTGAHLHYEVLMNSSQVNPMTLKMPTGKKLGRENLITFTEKISRLNEEMVLLKLQKDLESDPQKETKAP